VTSKTWTAVEPIVLPGPPRRVYPLIEMEHIESGVEVVDAGSEVPWHFHESSTEHFYFEQGSATMYTQCLLMGSDTEYGPVSTQEIQPGSAAVVPPRVRFVCVFYLWRLCIILHHAFFCAVIEL
jgi:mannose-6-phosphate isomerase-like protein (cupin superfamily)